MEEHPVAAATQPVLEELAGPPRRCVGANRLEAALKVDHVAGCLLGLALGDALGAPYEGGPLERLLWRCIGTTRRGEMRWTDDTQMTLDLAESIIANGGFEPDDVAQRFAASYRWSRGYGPAAAKLLKRIRRGTHWSEANRSVYPEGSFGNGGAMRAPVIGVFYASETEKLVSTARLSAQITHAHPLGIEGAPRRYGDRESSFFQRADGSL